MNRSTKWTLISLLMAGGSWILAQPPFGGPPMGPGGFPINPLVEALDLDKDGQISPEELKQATESLKKLDKNKDGVLSREEMMPRRMRLGLGKEGYEGKKEGKKGFGKKGPPDGKGGPEDGKEGPGTRPPFEKPDPSEKGSPKQGAAKGVNIPDAIAWYTDLEAGLAEAKQTGKPILLMSAAPSCGGVPGVW